MLHELAELCSFSSVWHVVVDSVVERLENRSARQCVLFMSGGENTKMVMVAGGLMVRDEGAFSCLVAVVNCLMAADAAED
eukprot:15346173-Ditylum_brightwellii.AAC.1